MKVILFWLLISYTTSLHLHSSIPVLKRDLVTVHVSTPSTDHQRTKRHADLPDVLHIQISNNQFDRSFHVEKDQDEESNTPVYIDGALFQDDPYPKIFTQFYRCIDRGCLIQAQKAIDLNTTNVFSDYLLFGTFEIDGQLHVLDHTENGEHVIAIPEESDFDCQVSSVHQEHDENVQIPELEMRQKRASSNYQVELLIVLDYSSYQFWLTAKKGVRTDAIDAIKQFYAFMVKGMDLRYENIRSATFSMDVLLAGLYVIENANSASFIEDIKNCSTGPPCKVDSNVVLARFQSWVQTNTTSLPHDHAMLFTRYDISTNGNNNATGYAYLGSMCSDQSVSVVEENFSFISQTIAAHELGHSLSAVHDGDQNLCSAANHYIMAASSFASLGSTAQNPWMFSTCSSAEIGARINILVSSTNNCLITSVATNPKSLDSYLSQNIGQIYSADQQCKLALGEASYSCRSLYPTADSFQSVCVGLWCKSTILVNKCSLILPAERTSCGSQKWCEGYLCVMSLQAPAMPANCIFGDQIGDIVSEYNCSYFVKTFPYQCYNPTYATLCCQSCNSIATGITGCEYGDKATGCKSDSCLSYSEQDRHLCCKTCAGLVIISSSTISTETTTETQQVSNTLPNWVLPVAITGGAINLLTVIVVVVCCIRMSRRAGKNKNKPYFNHRVSHDMMKFDRRQTNAQSSNWNRQETGEPRYGMDCPPTSRPDVRVERGQRSRTGNTQKEAMQPRKKEQNSNEAMYPQRNVNHRSYEDRCSRHIYESCRPNKDTRETQPYDVLRLEPIMPSEPLQTNNISKTNEYQTEDSHIYYEIS